MRWVATMLALGLVLVAGLQAGAAFADPALDEAATSCLSLVQSKDFEKAQDVCLKAYDSTQRNRLRNALLMEAIGQSSVALHNAERARAAYYFANRDANIAFRDVASDASAKTTAGQVLDRTGAALKALGFASDSYVLSTDTEDSPSCNRQAGIYIVAQPVFPDLARRASIGRVTALIDVSLDADGKLTNAKVYKSSGNAAIDGAAMMAAKATAYSAKIVHCKGVPADYLFRAEFSPD